MEKRRQILKGVKLQIEGKQDLSMSAKPGSSILDDLEAFKVWCLLSLKIQIIFSLIKLRCTRGRASAPRSRELGQHIGTRRSNPNLSPWAQTVQSEPEP